MAEIENIPEENGEQVMVLEIQTENNGNDSSKKTCYFYILHRITHTPFEVAVGLYWFLLFTGFKPIETRGKCQNSSKVQAI